MNEVTSIATRIKQLREEKDKLTEEEDTLWKRFFEICDDLAGEEENYKTIVLEIEQVIGREMHLASPKLLVEELKKGLTNKEWESITRRERVFDMTKLEEQIGKGNISVELVNKHTEHKKPVAHRKFKSATAKELRGDD